jgi:hypothetical protein
MYARSRKLRSYGIRRCQLNSDARSLVAVHALPPNSLPPCERSTKVKLLPCEGMTRPLKEHQAFGACQWHHYMRMPTMTPCWHQTRNKVKSHYHGLVIDYTSVKPSGRRKAKSGAQSYRCNEPDKGFRAASRVLVADQ